MSSPAPRFTAGQSVRERTMGATTIDAAIAIARRHKTELGYIMRPTLETAARRGELYVLPTAFAYVWHRRDHQTTLHAIASERRGQGSALLDQIAHDAQQAGQSSIVARCPVDLSANNWYSRQGFLLMATEPGKHRALNVWKLAI